PHPPEGARASLIKTDAGAGFCDSTYALPADVSCPTSTQCTLTPSASLLFNNQYTACLLESITYVSGSAFEGETAPFETAASDAAFASPAPEELSFAMFSENTANAGFAAGGEAYLLQGIGNGKFSKLSGAQFDLYYTAAAGTIDLLQTFSTEMQGDKAYIIGGLKNDGNLCPVPGGGTYSCATTETWSYDPATNDLAQGAAINNARDVAASGVVDGSIYLIGGWNPNADGENLSSVEVFDGSSWSEVDYAGRFYAVRSPAFAVVGKRVYVFGGCLQMGGCQQTMTQIFDAEENRFYQGADMSLAGRHFSGQHAVARQDRYIYVYGGATDMSATKFDDVAVYDTVANEWRTLDNTMTAERKSVGSVMLGDELYVAGGGVNSTEVGTFTPAP
ncbi:MAG TPA: kelch repeat-containing protein, partial [Denitromonas sp.]|nr:kelch repeat-containing protein [Denitromonas sp.]